MMHLQKKEEDEDENVDHLPQKMSTCCVVYECVYVFVGEIVGAEGERRE